ncbi:MAG: hypothetical protein RI894_2159, partial [Bacteroidota bacterium]
GKPLASYLATYIAKNEQIVQPTLQSLEAETLAQGGINYMGRIGFPELAVLFANTPHFLPIKENQNGGGGCSGGGGGGGCGGCGGS